jgi:hypothetical protein
MSTKSSTRGDDTTTDESTSTLSTAETTTEEEIMIFVGLDFLYGTLAGFGAALIIGVSVAFVQWHKKPQLRLSGNDLKMGVYDDCNV